MRRNPLTLNTRFLLQSIKKLIHSMHGDWFTTPREKNGVIFTRYILTHNSRQVLTVLREVIMKILEAITRDRHLLPFIALTMHNQEPQVPIYVTKPQVKQLTTTQASIDQHRQYSFIPRGQSP